MSVDVDVAVTPVCLTTLCLHLFCIPAAAVEAGWFQQCVFLWSDWSAPPLSAELTDETEHPSVCPPTGSSYHSRDGKEYTIKFLLMYKVLGYRKNYLAAVLFIPLALSSKKLSISIFVWESQSLSHKPMLHLSIQGVTLCNTVASLVLVLVANLTISSVIVEASSAAACHAVWHVSFPKWVSLIDKQYLLLSTLSIHHVWVYD